MMLSFHSVLCLALCTLAQASSPPPAQFQPQIIDSVKRGLDTLGFVMSTFSPTETPETVPATTMVEVVVVTPTPTVIVDQTDLFTLYTTVDVAATITSTMVETDVPTTTPEPPTPILTACPPFFYTNSYTLYWYKDALQLIENPFFQWKECQTATITSKAEAKQVASNICENVRIVDGQQHHIGFKPYECPIISPDAVIKTPRGGCDGVAQFRTLCQFKLN